MKTSIKKIRADATNEDFISLVKELDDYLTTINGENDSFFRAFNQIDMLKNVVVVYVNGQLSGCGAFKKHNENTVEIKRMYVKPKERRKGVAAIILNELENWAKESGFSNCILETSKEMNDAVSFYKNSGYLRIPNYDQYKNIDSSICFEKRLE